MKDMHTALGLVFGAGLGMIVGLLFFLAIGLVLGAAVQASTRGKDPAGAADPPRTAGVPHHAQPTRRQFRMRPEVGNAGEGSP